MKSFAIKIDPSGTGDKIANQKMRDESCPDCGWPKANAGEICASCNAKSRTQYRRRMADFNQSMLGTASPIHVHGVGYIDQNNPAHRRYLED